MNTIQTKWAAKGAFKPKAGVGEYLDKVLETSRNLQQDTTRSDINFSDLTSKLSTKRKLKTIKLKRNSMIDGKSV